jgi:hypothetical protein
VRTRPLRLFLARHPASASSAGRLLGFESFWIFERFELVVCAKKPEVGNVDLAAYLLEGWPERAADVLGRVGAGSELDPAFSASLGFGRTTLEARRARWLAETRPDRGSPALVTR